MLYMGFASWHLAGMVKWIHTHSHTLDTLIVSTGSPWVELILGSLLSSNMLEDAPAPLKRACLCNVQPDTVAVLGGFSGLKQLELHICTVSHDKYMDSHVDLDPLQCLPQLTDLVLHDGCFHGLDSLFSLTSLVAKRAYIDGESEYECVSSLQQLILTETSLIAFDDSGLSACSGLQSLHLASASMRNYRDFALLEFCHNEKPVVSPSSSALGALTALSIDYLYADLYDDIQLGWLSHLTSLQDLKLAVRVPQLDLPEGLSRLTRLTNMEVTSGPVGRMSFDFRWTALVALQRLLVCGSARFLQGLLDLTQVEALRHVKFEGLDTDDDTTMLQIGKLVYRLSVTRPDILFELL